MADSTKTAPAAAEDHTTSDERAFRGPEPEHPLDYERDLGDPGSFPYTRGLYADMYRRRLWTMRQYAGYSTAAESNRRYRYLLDQGTTGLSVAFDLPTQIGYDSDATAARGEVGKVGVAIDSIHDMRTLFDGIPLEQVTTSMTINSTAPILLALYLVVAEEQGTDWEKVGGTVQNDILKEYAARGTYIYPPGPSLRLVTDLVEFCSEKVPRWNPISISGYHMREAGSTAAQEIAFTLSNGLCYIDAALERGLAIDDFAPRLSFFFNAHNDFLEEVAKFRAARQLWAKLVRERYSPRNSRSTWLRFHTQTAGSTLTAQQPDNNVVRVAIQALAAVCGGTQSLHTNGRDEALSLPTEESALLALRTQQVIAHESGVTRYTDPLGGSWAIEATTERLVTEARSYIERIDGLGGARQAIEKGFQQREIADAAYQTQRAIEAGDEIIVGVNSYQADAETSPELLVLDPAAERDQVERLQAIRASRDGQRVRDTLDALERAAGEAHNLMPAILDCVKAEATLGEVSDRLRRVFGEHEESVFA
jgi:methylmalonyl-CoA mutase N-terminal domain/subunit